MVLILHIKVILLDLALVQVLYKKAELFQGHLMLRMKMNLVKGIPEHALNNLSLKKCQFVSWVKNNINIYLET